MPDLDEIMAFMKINNTLKYEQPFILKIMVPCVQSDLDAGSIRAIRFLFDCNDGHRVGTDKDYVYMFCFDSDTEYRPIDLADMVLAKEPDNEGVLHYKYILLGSFLRYSLHEIPLGVLSGIDGTKEEKMADMNTSLREFVALSERLGKDDKDLIQECTIMYAAYEQYLDHAKNYSNFEDYLIKHNIPY